MTKQLVRTAILAKLAVAPEHVLWDVGAGTGSVSVELALAAPKGRVYAVEYKPEACDLIRQNREALHLQWSIDLRSAIRRAVITKRPPALVDFLRCGRSFCESCSFATASTLGVLMPL